MERPPRITHMAVGILCLASLLMPRPTQAAGASAPEPPVPLFASAPAADSSHSAQAVPPQRPPRPWIRAQRGVTITPDALRRLSRPGAPKHAELTMDLITAGTHTAEVAMREQQGRLRSSRVWAGVLKEIQDSDVMLAVKDSVLVGSVRIGRTIYDIRPSAGGGHVLVEIDADQLPDDHHPIPVSRDEPGAPDDAGTAPAAGDSGSIIDVMVVYTPAAKNANGGQSGIEALIALGLSLANTALTNSQINTQFRLVHTAEVAYSESGSYSTDLSRLRIMNDGFMDDVHAWRNQYRADLVALIEDDLGGACGVAYVMTTVSQSFANWAFSVTQDSCISNYTLAHELGHNMGSQHDRAEGGAGAYPYSFGHKEPGVHRTIMATTCSPSCSRINHFSNPNVRYQGAWVTGIDHTADPAKSADNARGFTNALSTIANFRAAGDLTPPAAPANLRITGVR
ncbi:exported protein of unknown function [Nitrospira moscoviensis]|uniref:Peptidyl-Asp metalloendopeptidase n=2 Tax=Nitrospira moscoviensis TaxID=42253 RepID=A0A0K2GI15_NITMO|nr:exported protein of unknown function [Nitrospira moscoviensis]